VDMIPSIDFVRDFTEYSRITSEAVRISGNHKKVMPFKTILDRISEKIDDKADNGEDEYVLLFGNNNKNVKGEELKKQFFDSKVKRTEILARVFKRFGYDVECSTQNGLPALRISW